MNKKTVVLAALHYPVTMARYFWDAFERREDIDLFVIGPYFGNWIPWNGGITLNQKYVKTPNFPLPRTAANGSSFPYEAVKNQVPKNVDLFIQIDAGWHFDKRPDANIVALIETDPHVLKNHYKLPKSYSDITFCMQTPYMEAGEIYLPYGADTHSFYPEVKDMVHDACLIGLHYPQREKLVSSLRMLGMDVFYDIGVVYDDFRHKYNESRVALSWSSLLDLPVRVWEAMAMARPLVTNRVPDLGTFFVEGEHYLGFDTNAEAVSQVDYLIKNPDKAKEMGENAYRKILSGHTFDDRVEQILTACKMV